MKSSPLFRAQIFAAPPPPIGGVASIVNMLQSSLASIDGLGFSSPLPKTSSHSLAVRPLANLLLLCLTTFQVQRSGRILFFSSSGLSFFEKLLWSSIVRLLGRDPVIVMVDGHFPAFWSRLPVLFRHAATLLLHQSKATLGVQSQKWSSYFESIFTYVDCQVVGATVSSEYFAASPWQDSSRKPTILYVGWMTYSKGLEDLMQAFVSILGVYPDARLRLVGPHFENLNTWQSLASSLGIFEQTDFVGPISDRSRLIAEFQNATLFAFPSHAEGLPVVLLEAMSLGLPCIAADVGSVSDLFDNSNAGLLVPPCQPLRLASAIRKLLGSPEYRVSLSRKAFARVHSYYDEAQFIGSYLNILDL